MPADSGGVLNPPPTRLAYLDVMRGLAVVVMMISHVFHSFTRLDLRPSGGYQLSQSIGGMAAPLFLFLAGMMVGFRIESRNAKGISPLARMRDVLKRAAYIMLVAELILLQQFVFQWPAGHWSYLLRVDILNCMAVAVAASSVIALAPRYRQPQWAIALGCGIAALAPVVNAVASGRLPPTLANYLVPRPGHFAFFPEAAYVPIGIAIGCVIRRAGHLHIESAMRWIALAGCGILTAGEFFSNQPYSIYTKSDFWVDSPCLIAIRTGLMLLTLVVVYAWTKVGIFIGMLRQLGTTSLLVYWVHIELVYGSWLRMLKRRLTPGESLIALIAVTLLMYALSLAKTRWWGRLSHAKFRQPAAALDVRTS